MRKEDYGGEDMTCNFDEMLLYEYLDDLLEDHEKMLVNNHLSSCASCRKKMAEIKLLFYEIENIDPVDVPKEIESIREEVVSNAFKQDSQSTLSKISDSVKKTAVSVTPSKKQVARTVKGIYKGTKKVYQAIPKKEKPDKKVKSFGGLL